MDTQLLLVNKMDVAAFRSKLNDVETQSAKTRRCWSSTITTIRASTLR